LSLFYASLIGMTLLLLVLIGVILGSSLPLIQRRMRFDPGLTSAPVIATLMDFIGLGILFGLALAAYRGLIPWGQ
ncbi:MAG: magnesium transporter, partial [Proteobacteria bacterium]|nr:magnesium transporter [Pseudomonadota bacterium]